MNKTEIERNRILVFCMLSFFCLFLSSCGMQQYYSLDAPAVYHRPDYSSEDYTTKYFRFRTASNSDSGEFTVLGTAVYYKIYADSTRLNSDVNSVETVNTVSNGSAAARRVIETLGYKQLGSSAGARTPFIPGSSSQEVYIRLMSYGSEDAYAAKVSIGGAVQSWLPRRSDNNHTFEFGRTGSAYGSNASNNAWTSDDDVTGTSSNGVWYVNMYAVSVGRDANFTNYYSLVTHLGSVRINSGSEDN